jgi:flagellar basal body rod protein FlgF
MTLEELCELRSRAVKQTGRYVDVYLTNDGWSVITGHRSSANDTRNTTIEAVLADLRNLATPPKPPTVTITVPYEWAETIAGFHPAMTSDCLQTVKEACQSAIAPYKQV